MNSAPTGALVAVYSAPWCTPLPARGRRPTSTHGGELTRRSARGGVRRLSPTCGRLYPGPLTYAGKGTATSIAPVPYRGGGGGPRPLGVDALPAAAPAATPAISPPSGPGVEPPSAAARPARSPDEVGFAAGARLFAPHVEGRFLRRTSAR